MLAAAEEAAADERFLVFVAAPEWDEAFRSLARRVEFYNRLVRIVHGCALFCFFGEG
jgi:hypothetical protein